jgi:hypothetical protein
VLNIARHVAAGSPHSTSMVASTSVLPGSRVLQMAMPPHTRQAPQQLQPLQVPGAPGLIAREFFVPACLVQLQRTRGHRTSHALLTRAQAVERVEE